MAQKKSISFGFRGWMLIIYQALAFLAFLVFTNYPLNVLADLYGGAQIISTIYTVSMIVGIVIQLIASRFIGKVKNVKVITVILGVISLALALVIMIIPLGQVGIWQVVYFLECLIVTTWCTFTIGVLMGQWFPRRKGTAMGIATFAFPLGNAFVGLFAGNVFALASQGMGPPQVFSSFLPFLIISVIGLLIGAIFVKDYPEQCGAYRDNDKSITPEIGRAMMEQEIKAKENSVWKLGKTFASKDFWFLSIPMGFLLFGAVGMMTQTMSILGGYAEQLAFIGGFEAVMPMIAIVACFGSWLLGVLDTKYGTKFAMIISCALMVVSGIAGAITNVAALLIALACLAMFMGASSNFTVSGAAQYWRREDFPSVFAVVNPVANILQAIGPMVIAILISTGPYSSAFIMVGILGAISLVLTLMFKPSSVKATDDKYRKAAGLPLDNALAGRK